MTDKRRRIWGWSFFDWAQQPYATLGLTFIFAPYFAGRRGRFLRSRRSRGPRGRKRRASGLRHRRWRASSSRSRPPFFGAYADATQRKTPWFVLFIATAVICSAGLWVLEPDGSGLYLALALFWIGFVALGIRLQPQQRDPAEPRHGGRGGAGSAAARPPSATGAEFCRSSSCCCSSPRTTPGGRSSALEPALGLDGAAREGTRFVGPFIAIWFAVFAISRSFSGSATRRGAGRDPAPGSSSATSRRACAASSRDRPSAVSLLSSMLYRDALTALYAYGGIYATLVLDWTVVDIGVFGIIAAIAAAILSWVGGLADQRYGPKPVIRGTILVLVAVGCVIIGMSRTSLFGIPLAPDSTLPDTIFYVCGAAIGGAGGALYSASRSMMVRHCRVDNAAEAFGLFALTGRATAFLAPALITVFTDWTQKQPARLPADHLPVRSRIRSANMGQTRGRPSRTMARHARTRLTAVVLTLLALTSPVAANPAGERAFRRRNPQFATQTRSVRRVFEGLHRRGGAIAPRPGRPGRRCGSAGTATGATPMPSAFVERLSAHAATPCPGWNGLYVGDISQPRGGPMLTGHASHQSGLDIDIWMRPRDPPRPQPRRARDPLVDLGAPCGGRLRERELDQGRITRS